MRLNCQKNAAMDSYMFKKAKLVYKGKGFCPICEREVVFSAEQAWFRDYLLCSGCGSIPRERALMRVITECFPNYRELAIHESSPCGRGTSAKLSQECPNYSASHYFEHVPFGQKDDRIGYRCETLESLTFKDNSFDLFVTQDVMEHIFNPDLAFKEICRVLKPGGAHIFTVPIINKHKKSEVWASQNQHGETVFHGPEEYHGNPIDEKGSLVTMHWGYDIVAYISEATGMSSTILTIDDLSQGIKAELIDVVTSWCPEV
jgi:SAM-dependent methyltransferase